MIMADKNYGTAEVKDVAQRRIERVSRRRKFYVKGCQHIFQISVDGSLIFSTDADKILLFTLICTKAPQYHIHITSICIMLNHFHIQANIENREDMENFIYAVTWSFAYIYNRHYGLRGKVFHKSYGNAPKVKPKKIIENLIYIANNPVVKKAVESALDYRWNFLRYAPQIEAGTGRLAWPAVSRHPFSSEYNPLDASKDMLYLVKSVKLKAAASDWIDYKFFDSQRYKALGPKERQQILDIIIITYNVIDYEPMLRKYGSVESFGRVLSEVEGNEYDLSDDCELEDYRHYERMMKIAAEEGYDVRQKRYAGVGEGGHEMPPDLAERLVRRFKIEVGASNLETCKFLKIVNNKPRKYEKFRNGYGNGR